MARARNIKPGFYKNEDLAECSVWARLIFPGLWMLADREGRLEDRPKRIKGELLPFDAQDVEPLLRELAARGFIIRYKVDGSSFIQISKFRAHQSPHYSEKDSVIKPPQLPELSEDTEPQNSEKVLPIKRGSKPPDSLNPDSLNPENGSPAFAEFWALWPKTFRKEAKGKCKELWEKKGLDAKSAEILAHISTLKASYWTDPQFIPAPLVYLHQRRWEGAEMPEPQKQRMVL